MLSLPRRGLPGWTRSKFRVTDGTVANRPAVKGLAAKNVTVAGDQSTLA